MLSITVTMAVAVKKMLREGWKPKGTLIFSGMADEEALGTWGAEWLVNNKWDDVKADAVDAKHRKLTIFDFDIGRTLQRPIQFGDHCLGCTAGAGSSCGGATA
jgi:hypothetical protein